MLVADRSVNNRSTAVGMITVFAKTSMERLIDFVLIPSGYLMESQISASVSAQKTSKTDFAVCLPRETAQKKPDVIRHRAS